MKEYTVEEGKIIETSTEILVKEIDVDELVAEIAKARKFGDEYYAKADALQIQLDGIKESLPAVAEALESKLTI